MIKENEIYLGDCLDIMRDIPDKSIDLVLTDPPYCIGASKMNMGSGDHIFSKDKGWDNVKINELWFKEMFRISKNQIIWGGNYFTKYLKPSPHWLLWDKNNPNLSFAEGELAWLSKGDNLRIFKHYSATEKKVHITQKPLELFNWCIKRYSKENDLIFDGFAGSGTTALACIELNRRFICVEKDKDYYNIAKKRIDDAKNQLTLF